MSTVYTNYTTFRHEKRINKSHENNYDHHHRGMWKGVGVSIHVNIVSHFEKPKQTITFNVEFETNRNLLYVIEQ